MSAKEVELPAVDARGQSKIVILQMRAHESKNRNGLLFGCDGQSRLCVAFDLITVQTGCRTVLIAVDTLLLAS